MKFNRLLLTTGLVLAGSLVGCGSTEAEVQVGTGYVASFSDSTLNETLVSVVMKDGKVLKADIDVLQVKIAAEEDEVTENNETKAAFAYSIPDDRSKVEKGDFYGMSKAGKTEYYKQIDNLETALVGKTADEVANAEEKSGFTGVTISTVDHKAAFAKAVKNAKTVKVADYNALKLGVAFYVGTKASTVVKTKNFEFAVDFASSLTDGTNVLASYVDNLTVPVNAELVPATKEGEQDYYKTVLASGTKYVVNDVLTSKRDLGTAYGMKQYGGNYEWNEQAAAFDAYFETKTIKELTDLTAEKGSITGTSITPNNTVAAAKKAAQYSLLTTKAIAGK
jgi:hypothetical protein